MHLSDFQNKMRSELDNILEDLPKNNPSTMIFRESLKFRGLFLFACGPYPLQEIYSDIFNESVFVTGISRVLSNPIQDTVTIQQPSRYKSILAKLIKSI